MELGVRGKWVWKKQDNGKFALVPITDSKPKVVAPAVHTDEMDPVESPASGKIYDSKSALRREYKEKGFYEVGNDLVGKRRGISWKQKVEPVEVSMKRAMEKLQSSSYREELRQKRERGLLPKPHDQQR